MALLFGAVAALAKAGAENTTMRLPQNLHVLAEIKKMVRKSSEAGRYGVISGLAAGNTAVAIAKDNKAAGAWFLMAAAVGAFMYLKRKNDVKEIGEGIADFIVNTRRE